MKLAVALLCCLLSASALREPRFEIVVASSKPVKAEAMSAALASVTVQLLAKYVTPQEVNSGHCGSFALLAQAKVGGTIVHIVGPNGGGHTVLEVAGRMYDIEHPEGVTRFGDLKFYQRST